MGLTAEQITAGLDEIAAREPAIARALKLAGYPPPRVRPTG
jgi:DNA-3-methyladenine glycosylase II